MTAGCVRTEKHGCVRRGQHTRQIDHRDAPQRARRAALRMRKPWMAYRLSGPTMRRTGCSSRAIGRFARRRHKLSRCRHAARAVRRVQCMTGAVLFHLLKKYIPRAPLLTARRPFLSAVARINLKTSSISLGNVTQHNVKQLRLLNSTIFPVSYNNTVRGPSGLWLVAHRTQFYTNAVAGGEFYKLGASWRLFKIMPIISAYFDDVVVGGVCARLEDDGATLYIMTIGCLAPYRRLGIGGRAGCGCGCGSGESGGCCTLD